MILKERMFRVKPYTKCLDCIRTDQLKCKNCMEKLVNDIMISKDSLAIKQVPKKYPKSRSKLQTKYPSQQRQFSVPKPSTKTATSSSQCRSPSTSRTYQIHSKYELWMRHINFKKEEEKQQSQSSQKAQIKNWPKKKRVYLSSIDAVKQNKIFRKWQQKFLDRIKDSTLKQNVQHQRLTKTSFAKLRV